MKIIYPKPLSAEENSIINEISVKCGVLKTTARLMFERGVKDVVSAKRFLNPGKNYFLNPFGLSGMKDAVDRIRLAKENDETVLVFGDYDADGICATTVLCGCLEMYGLSPLRAIPEREEGYGLNVAKINALSDKRKINLVITVDCGISDAEKIEILKSEGIDVIVTDHHEPPENLPKCICIDPKIKGQEYGFDGLCGGGVAYKLGRALIGEKADAFLDFVAIATVADSMDLIGENRDIVAEGLKMINGAPRSAFKAFLGDAYKDVTAQTLAYAVAPRINAGGRMGDASAALRLFSAKNEKEIFDLSVKLNAYNMSRQELCEDAFTEAKETIVKTGANADRVVFVRGENWKTGVIGIVAAKLVEVYGKPVIVFAKSDGFYKGSARSVDGCNIYDAVFAAREYLTTFGGHSQAAGLSVSEENFDKLKKAVNDYAETNFADAERDGEVLVDVRAEDKISMRFAKEIELLEPFGVGNRRPVFATECGAVNMTPLKLGSPHYSFMTDAVEMLDFNGAKDVEKLALPVPKTLIFELNVSTFRNVESLKGFLKAVECDFGDFTALSSDVFKRGLSVNATDYIPEETDIKIERGYGTAYVVSDVKTLGMINCEGLSVYPYEIPTESGRNCIVIAPDKIPETYKTVLYIDEPIFWQSFDGRAKRLKNPFYRTISDITVERKTFEDAFKLCSENERKPEDNFIRDSVKGKNEKQKRQILFCYAVFSELGFFKIVNGVVVRDRTVKKPLTDSVLYKAVGEKNA